MFLKHVIIYCCALFDQTENTVDEPVQRRYFTLRYICTGNAGRLFYFYCDGQKFNLFVVLHYQKGDQPMLKRCFTVEVKQTLLDTQDITQYFTKTAQKIDQKPPKSNKHFSKYLKNKNLSAPLLQPVTEKEIRA